MRFQLVFLVIFALSFGANAQIALEKDETETSLQYIDTDQLSNEKTAMSSRMYCSPGSFASYDLSRCVRCTVGTYEANYGAVCGNPAGCVCRKCPEGYVCPTEGTYNPQQCSAGSFASYDRTKCVKCAPGTYEINSGAACSNPSGCVCRKCPESYVCPYEGMSSFQICLAGFITSYDRTRCIKCSAGFYEPNNGAFCTNPDSCSCRKCPDGNVCPSAGATTYQKCPAGSIANYERTGCTRCAPGTYTAEAGWYCKVPNCSCNKCPSGVANIYNTGCL